MAVFFAQNTHASVDSNIKRTGASPVFNCIVLKWEEIGRNREYFSVRNVHAQAAKGSLGMYLLSHPLSLQAIPNFTKQFYFLTELYGSCWFFLLLLLRFAYRLDHQKDNECDDDKVDN